MTARIRKRPAQTEKPGPDIHSTSGSAGQTAAKCSAPVSDTEPVMLTARVIRHDGAGYLEPDPGVTLRGVPWPRPEAHELWRYMDIGRPINPRLSRALSWPLSISRPGLETLLSPEHEGAAVQLTGLPGEAGPDSRVLARATRLPGAGMTLELRERRSLCQRLAPAARLYLQPLLPEQGWLITHEDSFDDGTQDHGLNTAPCEAALWGAAWLSGHYATSEGLARWDGQGLTGVHQGGQHQGQTWSLTNLPAHAGNPLGSLLLREGQAPPRELSLAQGARFMLALG